MPGDTEQALVQFGARPPGLSVVPDDTRLLSYSGLTAGPHEGHQPPDHADPPGGQDPHYDVAGLAYSSVDAAEVIGRLRSVGIAYPNSR
ncbi:MAG TPA: hypothetical protein VFU32_04360 [Ktedonobacterales bacterium]|nr:hypothetical protein [Ktedonobacterales bacterium]